MNSSDNPLLPHRPTFTPKVSRYGKYVILITPHGTYMLEPHEALKTAADIGIQVFGHPPFLVNQNGA